MEWWEVIGLVVCLVVGAYIRDFVNRNKYRWWDDGGKGRLK